MLSSLLFYLLALLLSSSSLLHLYSYYLQYEVTSVQAIGRWVQAAAVYVVDLQGELGTPCDSHSGWTYYKCLKKMTLRIERKEVRLM